MNKVLELSIFYFFFFWLIRPYVRKSGIFHISMLPSSYVHIWIFFRPHMGGRVDIFAYLGHWNHIFRQRSHNSELEPVWNKQVQTNNLCGLKWEIINRVRHTYLGSPKRRLSWFYTSLRLQRSFVRKCLFFRILGHMKQGSGAEYFLLFFFWLISGKVEFFVFLCHRDHISHRDFLRFFFRPQRSYVRICGLFRIFRPMESHF